MDIYHKSCVLSYLLHLGMNKQQHFDQYNQLFVGGPQTLVCLSQHVWLVRRWQPLSSQEVEMNHERQIKRRVRTHHILLNT